MELYLIIEMYRLTRQIASLIYILADNVGLNKPFEAVATRPEIGF